MNTRRQDLARCIRADLGELPSSSRVDGWFHKRKGWCVSLMKSYGVEPYDDGKSKKFLTLDIASAVIELTPKGGK